MFENILIVVICTKPCVTREYKYVCKVYNQKFLK